MSASLAAGPVAVCPTPEATSTPICAFIPKCHWLPFLVWCISGSRALLLFLVEGGAAMIVASTIVPWRISNPRSSSIAPISSNSARVRSCCSSQWRKFSTVVASGTVATDRSMPLLQKVDPQHPLQPNRRSAPLALRIERPQTIDQPPPRHHLLHLGQKTVPPRLLFLPGVFRLRKAALPLHRFPQTDREILPGPGTHRRRVFSA